jgi:uncharacterized membrane protein
VKHALESLTKSLVAGLLLFLPVYLAVLMLMKAMKSVSGVVRPLAHIVPAWFPGETAASLLLVLLLCLLTGIVLRTAVGQAAQARIEDALFDKIPGYQAFRGMTRQLAGQKDECSWQPALVEIENALVPGFIVEEIEDGRLAVFVPSVPTPLAGTIYILSAQRVHPVDVSFTQAIKTVTRWGVGSKDLVAAMHDVRAPAR